MKKTTIPMRLAMRAEGDNWNAYVAQPDRMDGAIWIGSIRLRFIEDSPERKEIFLALMQDAMNDMLEKMFNRKPVWDEPVEAPEHERTRE
jgi:hypothetical protein